MNGDFTTDKILPGPPSSPGKPLSSSPPLGAAGKDGRPRRIECSKAACSQISKPGCLYALCKRCCVQRLKTESTAGVGDTSSLLPCPVHKPRNKKKIEATHSDSSPPPTPSPYREAKVIQKEPYQSACKVLVVGIGADEQLAGYSRHRSVYLQGGLAALVAELDMDTARIYNRNLGR